MASTISIGTPFQDARAGFTMSDTVLFGTPDAAAMSRIVMPFFPWDLVARSRQMFGGNRSAISRNEALTAGTSGAGHRDSVSCLAFVSNFNLMAGKGLIDVSSKG